MWPLDQLPAEIRESTRCVIWRYAPVGSNGRRTKVPYIATQPAELASSTDATTWRAFDDARGAYEDGKADGPGFVLGDGIVGLDIDGCIDDDGLIDDDAHALITEIGSYCEVSPSGRGVHILVRGLLPPGRRRRGRYELYDQARYFTLTGLHLEGTPQALVDATPALHAIHARLFPPPAWEPWTATDAAPDPQLDDAQLLERMFAARNGAAIRLLWDGDISAYPSQSEADLALCRHLAFWTNRDALRIDQLFRQSALCRDKWQRADYRDRTIAAACASCDTGFSGGPAPDVIIDEPVPEDGEPVPFIERFPAFCARLRHQQTPADVIPGWVPGHGLTLVHGHPRSLKTWVLLEWARACATGGRVFGLDLLTVETPRRVWFLTEEDSERTIRDRFVWLFAGADQSWPETLYVSPQRGISLDDAAWQKRILTTVADEQLQLMFVDPVRASSVAVDQGPRELAPLIRFLRVVMRTTGCAIVLSHHDVKPPAGKPDDRARPQRASGGGIFSVAIAPIHLERLEPDRSQTLLTPGFFKFAPAPAPMLVSIESDNPHQPTWVRVIGTPTSAATAAGLVLHQRIRDHLGRHPGTSGSALARALQVRKAAVLAALEQLARDGEVDSYTKGKAVLWMLKQVAV